MLVNVHAVASLRYGAMNALVHCTCVYCFPAQESAVPLQRDLLACVACNNNRIPSTRPFSTALLNCTSTLGSSSSLMLLPRPFTAAHAGVVLQSLSTHNSTAALPSKPICDLHVPKMDTAEGALLSLSAVVLVCLSCCRVHCSLVQCWKILKTQRMHLEDLL